jgi:hypothetical protein
MDNGGKLKIRCSLKSWKNKKHVCTFFLAKELHNFILKDKLAKA